MYQRNYTMTPYKTGPFAPQTTPGPRRPAAPRTDTTECQAHAARAEFLARLEDEWVAALLAGWEGEPNAR